MSESLSTVLVPGLMTSARLYAEQLPHLWKFGAVTVADNTRDDTIAGIARRVLAVAPTRFALVGLSMGGYVSMEIMRQAPERVMKLALLDTTARPDLPQQTERRRAQIAMAEQGRFMEVADMLMSTFVHRSRQNEQDLRGLVRQMAEESGAAAFIRQQTAIMGRIDSRPFLPAIRCQSLILVGEGDELTPPDRAVEMAELIKGARLVVVPDCGHLSTVERPQQVSQALIEWLSRQ